MKVNLNFYMFEKNLNKARKNLIKFLKKRKQKRYKKKIPLEKYSKGK